MGLCMGDPKLAVSKSRREARERKRIAVLRLVEAQISGCVDLSPDEMIEAAFLMVDKIDERIYGREKD